MIQEELQTCYNTIAFPLFVKARCVGSRCNLDCGICKEVKDGSAQKDETMSNELLEEFIFKYIDAQIHTGVHFEWQGGEPLLAGIPFFQQVLIYQEKYRKNRQITNTIISNGTLINDDWCHFFKRHQFTLIIRIDGPQNCHDYYRIRKDHQGSHRDTLRGIMYLQKHNIPFTTQVTIHDYNVNYPLEIYHFLKDHHLYHVDFIPHIHKKGGQLTAQSVPSLSWGNFLCEIFDEWVRKDVGKMHIKLFENTLNIFSHKEAVQCTYAPSCGHTAIIENDGKIYSCANVNSHEHLLGDIHEDTITGHMYGRKQLRFGQQKRSNLSLQCKKCAHLRLCNGGCLNHRVGISNTGERHHNILCLGYQRFYNHTSPAMVFMAEEIMNGGSASRIKSYFQTSTSE